MTSKKNTKLSKGLLEMKFMKRSKVQSEQEAETNIGIEMYRNEITKKMGTNSNFTYESSIAMFEDLTVFRYSCGGMNPEIEKILENERICKDEKSSEMKVDVSNKEMQNFYSKNNEETTHKRKAKNDFSYKSNKKTKY